MIAQLAADCKPYVHHPTFLHGILGAIKDKLPLLTSMGDRLRYARKRKHLSQEAVGDRVGRTRGAVGQWERNETLPDLAPTVTQSHSPIA